MRKNKCSVLVSMHDWIVDTYGLGHTAVHTK